MSTDPSPELTSSLITGARAWYDAGYCVVPTHPDNGKRPFIQWRDFQTERPSWDQVERWLESGQYTGIGVVLGPSSGEAEAIEIEGPLDAAIERLQRVVAKAGEYDEINLTDLLSRAARGCVEQSAGGGMHLFIRVTDGPALGNTKLAMRGQGADRKVVSETRGAGGFMVVAPTPGRNGHAEGTSYLFINGGTPDKTVEVTAEERDMLHQVFSLALDESVPEPEPERETHPNVETPYDGQSTFDDFRQRVSWRDILEPAGWTWSHRDSTRDYWVRPGKSKAEGHSASTIEDGPLVNFSSTVAWPEGRGLSKGHVHALIHHDGDLSAAAKDLMEMGYGVPPTHELPHWEAQLDPDATPQERTEAAGHWVEENLPRLNWEQVWKEEYNEDWLVEPLISRRRLVALYSPPKAGKSLLLLEIAAALATGTPVLGIQNVPKVRTLYVDFENDPVADTRERLTDMGYDWRDLDNLVVLSFPNLAKLDTERGSQELLAAALYYGCEIVVIDTVSRAVKGEENSNDTWLDFYRHTGLKLKQHGLTLVRLDHSGKDVDKGMRGGSAKYGDVDAVWRMTVRGEDTVDLVCEANRFPISEKSLTAKRISENGKLRHRVVGNPWADQVRRAIEKMVAAGVPKDRKLKVRDVENMIREAGLTVASNEIKKRIIEEYANKPDTWDDISMLTGGDDA